MSFHRYLYMLEAQQPFAVALKELMQAERQEAS